MFFLIFVLVPMALPWSPEDNEPFSDKDHQTPAATPLPTDQVEIVLHTGRVLSGTMVDITDDTVILLRAGQEQKIPKQEVRIIVVKERYRNILSLVLLLTYLEHLIFLTDENDKPPFYANYFDSSLGFLYREAFLLSANTGLSFLLFDALGISDKVFEFAGKGEDNLAEWERLKITLRKSRRWQKLRFTFQAGRVFPQISNRRLSLLQDRGFYVYKDPSLFNLLRRIQITYPLTQDLEVGLAHGWLSEPMLRAWRYQEVPYSSVSLQESFSSNGYYLVGVYRPLSRTLPNALSWDIGLGIGGAKTTIDTKAEIFDTPYSNRREAETKVSRTQFSALAFTELKLNISKFLTFGLAADYFLASTVRLEAIPEAELPAQTFRVGNGSIGFSLALHF